MRRIIINEVDAAIQIKESVVDPTPESAPASNPAPKTSKKKDEPKNEATSSSR